MTKVWSPVVVMVFAMAAMAGCVGGSDPPVPTDLGSTADEAGFDDETGALKGRITNEEGFPVAGAQLLLMPGGNSTTSATDGTYSFSFVVPRAYQLFVNKLGYESLVVAATLQAGKATEQNLRLVAIQVLEPHREVLGPFDGFMQCRMATPLSSGACGFVPVVGNTPITALWTNDKIFLEFELTRADWQQIVFEARWSPSTAATNPDMMMVFSYTERQSTHWWADSGGGPSPINMVYTRGENGPGGQLPSGTPDEPDWQNHTMRTWLTLPFASLTQPVDVAYDLRYEVMVSIFYSSEAPEGYTALPDA